MWYLCESHNFKLKIMGFNTRSQIYKNIYEDNRSYQENILFNY